MPSYSYRPYRTGDETAINNLYGTITGRKRSADQYFWQWHCAPAGKGDIWLIEVDPGDGLKQLIGHHGVMPIRFSVGDKNVLFGKTENTFVLPQYRRKILYPKFESKFRAVYESRFHALFSTMGPEAAIRQRKSQGYDFPAVFRKLIWGTSLFGILSYLFSIIYKKSNPSAPVNFLLKSRYPPQKNMKINNTRIFHFSPSEAAKSSFFNAFWKSVQQFYPITPCRDHDDLKWRYWDNPYVFYHTLVLDSVTCGAAVAILHRPVPGKMIIDDFFVEHPSSKSFGRLLKSVIKWAARNGGHGVEFTTTDDSIAWIGRHNFDPGLAHQSIQTLINRWNPPKAPKMPRKVTESGHKLGISAKQWYVTSTLLEGVSP